MLTKYIFLLQWMLVPGQVCYLTRDFKIIIDGDTLFIFLVIWFHVGVFYVLILSLVIFFYVPFACLIFEVLSMYNILVYDRCEFSPPLLFLLAIINGYSISIIVW